MHKADKILLELLRCNRLLSIWYSLKPVAVPDACAWWLICPVSHRLSLRLLNTLLALVGLAMICYSVYMFIKFKHTDFQPSEGWTGTLALAPQPRKAGFPW